MQPEPPPSTQTQLLQRATSRETSVRNFAIGRVLSVAAAGEPCVHPSVRWGGPPGRRSHTNTTQWALGSISTVRIGAGAWPICQAQEKAATPVGKPHLTVLWKEPLRVEEKGKPESRKKTLLGKRICGRLGARGRGRKVRWAHRGHARLRSVPPPRAASVSRQKNLADLLPTLTTLIGAAAHG